MFFRIQNLHINLGQFYLENVSLDIEKGDYLNVIGPTGAGKSILLESIIGFYRPDSGRIFLEGRDITDTLPEKRHISIVYQDYALLPHFTVFKNIAYGLKKIQKNGIKEKVQEIAEALKIDHLLNRKPGTLSGGEQQRTALARSLVVEPKLLLMDEPFSALDPVTCHELRYLLKQVIKRQKTTVIHITHNLDDVWTLANKTGVLYGGHLLQFGRKEEIFEKPNCKMVADFVEASLFEGQVIKENNETSLIRINDFELRSRDKAQEGQIVKVAVRPENIAISRTRPTDKNTNVIETRIKDVLSQGELGTLFLETGQTIITVRSTSSTLNQLHPQPQDKLYAYIDYDHVRLI